MLVNLELGRSNVGEEEYSVIKSGCTNKSFLEDKNSKY